MSVLQGLALLGRAMQKHTERGNEKDSERSQSSLTADSTEPELISCVKHKVVWGMLRGDTQPGFIPKPAQAQQP